VVGLTGQLEVSEEVSREKGRRRSTGDNSRHCWRRRMERAYDQGEGGWEIKGGEVEGSECLTDREGDYAMCRGAVVGIATQ